MDILDIKEALLTLGVLNAAKYPRAHIVHRGPKQVPFG